jgi:hypothetical protein
VTRYFLTTLGRARRQETLGRLHPKIRARTTVVIQFHELEQHQYLRDHGIDDILPLPLHIDNLGPTRQYLLDRFRGEQIVMLDDDLVFMYRADPPNWPLTTYGADGALEPFLALDRLLDAGFAHASLSGREGNNRVAEEVVQCTRYMRVLAYNTALFPSHVRMDRVNGMSDFDTNLQLLRAGLPSAVNFWFAQGQGGTQQPGGCSLNRTHATHSAEIDFMCETHGDLVRRRLKQNKGGGEFGTREELTIYWKKALGHG